MSGRHVPRAYFLRRRPLLVNPQLRHVFPNKKKRPKTMIFREGLPQYGDSPCSLVLVIDVAVLVLGRQVPPFLPVPTPCPPQLAPSHAPTQAHIPSGTLTPLTTPVPAQRHAARSCCCCISSTFSRGSSCCSDHTDQPPAPAKRGLCLKPSQGPPMHCPSPIIWRNDPNSLLVWEVEGGTLSAGDSQKCSEWGGGGFGMTPWCDDLVCSWRRVLADRHSLPFPWTLSLYRRWCPSASHHPVTFLFLPALTVPLPCPFLEGGGGGAATKKQLGGSGCRALSRHTYPQHHLWGPVRIQTGTGVPTFCQAGAGH